MNGDWVFDIKADTWHLITLDPVPDGYVGTWCGERINDTDEEIAETKSGSQLVFVDILHDECVRKAAEL